MSAEFTLEQLAHAVQDWCEKHGIFPANGQAAEQITERNIRYYRTLGLLDPPIGTYTKKFDDKHRLQLIAIRLYQAHGLPLRKIREELYGKSMEDLVALEKAAGKGPEPLYSLESPWQPVAAAESWSVVLLAGDFLLVSRQNRQLPRGVIQKLNDLLQSVRPENENNAEPSRN